MPQAHRDRVDIAARTPFGVQTTRSRTPGRRAPRPSMQQFKHVRRVELGILVSEDATEGIRQLRRAAPRQPQRSLLSTAARPSRWWRPCRSAGAQGRASTCQPSPRSLVPMRDRQPARTFRLPATPGPPVVGRVSVPVGGFPALVPVQPGEEGGLGIQDAPEQLRVGDPVGQHFVVHGDFFDFFTVQIAEVKPGIDGQVIVVVIVRAGGPRGSRNRNSQTRWRPARSPPESWLLESRRTYPATAARPEGCPP